jgi:hypothetical protein
METKFWNVELAPTDKQIVGYFGLPTKEQLVKYSKFYGPQTKERK